MSCSFVSIWTIRTTSARASWDSEAGTKPRALSTSDDRRTLRRAPSRDRVEASLVQARPPTGPLRDVQHDPQACALKLIAQDSVALGQYRRGDRLELAGDSVHVKPLGVQARAVHGARERGGGSDDGLEPMSSRSR